MSSNGHGHHITPISKLVSTFAALIALMVLTIVAAQLPYWMPQVDILSQFGKNPFLTNTIAMGIAITKAWLVVSIFMGVKHSTNLTKFYAIGGFVWCLLLFLIMLDYIARPWEPVQGWEKAPATGLPRNANQPDGTDKTWQPFRLEKSEKGEKGAH